MKKNIPHARFINFVGTRAGTLILVEIMAPDKTEKEIRDRKSYLKLVTSKICSTQRRTKTRFISTENYWLFDMLVFIFVCLFLNSISKLFTFVITKTYWNKKYRCLLCHVFLNHSLHKYTHTKKVFLSEIEIDAI